MLREPHRNETPKSIFNPLLKEFKVQMADENNHQNTYILPPQDISTFPTYIANHIIKNLALKVYVEKYGGRVTRESVMPEILKEIEI